MLQTTAATTSSEGNSLHIRVQSLQSRNTELELRFNHTLEKLEESSSRILSQEQQFKAEISNQTKLVSLYQSQCQDITNRNEVLESHIKTMTSEQQSNQETIDSIQRNNSIILDECRALIYEKELQIEKMGAELSVMNKGIEQGTMNESTLSQTANAASRLQKSGKTFTQVVNLYFLKVNKMIP